MTRPTPITDPAELDAIEARAEKATPGPWRHDQEAVRAGLDNFLFEHGSLKNYDADNAFIAAARSDVPRLIATVRALWAKDKPGVSYCREAYVPRFSFAVWPDDCTCDYCRKLARNRLPK